MRKYLTLFIGIAGSLVLGFGLTSCEGPIGPPGPPGPPGFDGADGLIGSIFEAQVDFDKADNYEAFVDFPSNIEVFDTDVVIAYILTAVDNGTDIWEPLPQTLFFDADILLYQELDDLIEAVTRKGEHDIYRPCAACLDGNYVTGKISKQKIVNLENQRNKERLAE